MPPRSAAIQQEPANLAPLVALLAVVGAGVGTWFQLPGAVIAALGLTLASFFFHAPPQANAKEPLPEKVQLQARRWTALRWRALLPNGAWVLNAPDALPGFTQKAQSLASRLPLPAPVTTILGQVLGALAWLITPTRFVQQIAIGASLIALTLPANLSALASFLPAGAQDYDLVWLNALLAYGAVMGIDAAIRGAAAISDPSPGVGVSSLLGKATTPGDAQGGALRALVGFTILGVASGVGAVLAILALGLAYLVIPVWLFGLGVSIIVAAACMHGAARNDALAEWRDQVAARAQWVPRWEALKYPEVAMTSHERVGSFVVDTFEAPPSLGSVKAINLYNSVVPYLAAGGEVTVAMLTVEASDSQGQPIPGSAHATRFRVVVAPSDADVATLDPSVNVEEVKLAAEVGAFHAARAVNAQVPILLSLNPAHTSDSPTAVWETEWTVPLSSASAVASFLGVSPEDGIFNEGRSTFFGDFAGATLSDRTLPSRMEQAAYIDRWSLRWADALKMGEKAPHLQYAAIKREKLNATTELVYEPFLVGQGLSPMRFFSKDMRERITTTLKAAPFMTVIGITGPLAGTLGPGIRHGQGFVVVHSSTPIPSSPADIAPAGPRARDVAKWVLGGNINRAFEDAKLAYPEVISAEALTSPRSAGHVWKVSLRLYEGVTAAMVKAASAKLQQALGGVRWLRVEESETGCYLVMGAMPHADGVRFTRPDNLAYCDRLDWAEAFGNAGIRAVTDGSTPSMVENEPLESNEKVTRMVFTMPSGMNFGKVLEATDKLRAATGNDYVDIRQHEMPDRFIVLAAEQDPIPFPAFPDWDYMADTTGKKRTRLPFAQTTDGSIVTFDWSLDPHVNILGQSGGGKSILLQILMCGALLRDCDVFLIDPIKGGQDFDFAVPFIRAAVEQGDYLGAGELMQVIGQEAEDRKKLNVRYKVGNYKDLPDDVRPRHMFVIIDELQSLLKSQAKLSKEPDSDDALEIAAWEAQRQINTGVGKLAKFLGKLAREARSVGITLVLAGQAMKATDLAAVGLNGLKGNFSRIAVGKMSYGDMASAFKDPATLPKLGAVVPPGRGIFESTAAAAVIVQNWWEKDGQAEMGRQLAARISPIDDERKVDVATLSARVLHAQPKGFGEIVEDLAVEDGPDEAVALDASDFGLEGAFDFSFDDDDDDDVPPREADEFSLIEPPTDLPLADAPDEALDEPTGPSAYDRAMFHPGEFIDMPTGLYGRVHLGPGGEVIFGVNAPTGDGFETGWPEGDALRRLLISNPGITEIVWEDEALGELDEIGIPRRDIAIDIAAAFSVPLVTDASVTVPEGSVPQEETELRTESKASVATSPASTEPPLPAKPAIVEAATALVAPEPAGSMDALFALDDSGMFDRKPRDVDLGEVSF